MNDADHNDELAPLAEHLSTLSEPVDALPVGFGEAGPSFKADEVDWLSPSWVMRVVDVQPWLWLDAPLEPDNGVESVLEGLWEHLGSDVECHQIVGGVPRLTAAGTMMLTSHLEDANRHRCEFLALIEDGLATQKATSAWIRSWDEDASFSSGPVEVHARVKTLQIYNIRDQAREGSLILNPSYQRDTVWSPSESVALIDSILRGIPLPSIIFNQRKGADEVEIVDGKQRLTAILRFIGHHPDGVAFAKTKSREAGVDFELFRTDYRKWARKVNKSVGLTSKEGGAEFLPFPYRLPSRARSTDPLAALSKKYYCEIKDETVHIQGHAEKIGKVFEKSTTKYELPVILYEDTDVRQIHSVFGLYNRNGKKLNATEVRNAIYHHLELTRLLLLLSGDSENVASLAPYLASTDIDLSLVPELLMGLNVSTSRFNRTKLLSWVVALISHQPKGVPGSTKYIESLLRSMSKSTSHPLASETACMELARVVIHGTKLFGDLRDMEAFHPSFTHRKSPGEKWADPAAVATWLACVLGAMGSVTLTDEVRDRVHAYTSETKPLEKQQAKTQWGYISSVVIGIIDAFGLSQASSSSDLKARFAYDCIGVFRSMSTGE